MNQKSKPSDNIKPKPEAGIGDAAHTITRAGLSAIPVVGGPAKELFSAIIVPPLTKRRDEWIESISTALKALEEKVVGFSIESLSQNDMFITTVMHASQSASRNHQKEKLEALRNAVLNAALPSAPEEDYQLMFLYFVDTFTPWHLIILRLFDDPKVVIQEKGLTEPGLGYVSMVDLVEYAFSELKNKSDFNEQIIKQLESSGLIRVDPIREPRGGLVWERTIEPRTTDLGKRFLKFITSPL